MTKNLFPLSDERCEEIISAAHKTVAALKRDRGMSRKEAWLFVLETTEAMNPSPAAKRLLTEYVTLIIGGKPND